MADEREDFQRTEEPTPRRREEARKKGEVAHSRNLIPAATLFAGVLVLNYVGETLIERIGRIFVGFFSRAGDLTELGSKDIFALSHESGRLFLPVIIPLFGSVVLAGMMSGLCQTGFLFTTETLRPNFARVNPLNGLRRLFGADAAIEFVKAFLSLICLGALGFFVLYPSILKLSSLVGVPAGDVITYGGREALRLLGAGAVIIGVTAGLEYLVQRWRVEARLRMSRQELKEELREHEGDPVTKARLRGLMQKQARRRMMADVAKADVIITNPQELAVALRYHAGEMNAPRVVAKGAGWIAKNIREIARKKSIAIVENKPLAQLLYRSVNVGQEIPENLYRVVAEVLAYVYRLRGQTSLNGSTV
ncbi:MAG: EscU/YscU/HrcU family type III secretion system export apparatus switch protein [Deltaproteobacteria bacterium]|nr:EscU/YscU/HrcU family type III secretion system export apparatus switch protein [Deltaproteobacteria bacterium]